MIRKSDGCRGRTLGLKFMTGASAGVLGLALLAGAAHAQTTESDTVEEVIVTGLRASLDRSIDVKRSSALIVDSIASEDLGKFPDTNVAESLQRITGVSIDRSGGEGRFVTVRGFGPSFNQLLLNGRTLATENPGRQFSFDMLPAELISGADVYKSSNAQLQEGGIGSTINLKTARPFDHKGQRIILSAQGNYEDLSGKTTPNLFGLYSNTFMDGRLGVLGSVSFQERKARIDAANNDGYYATTVGGKTVYMPQNYNQYSDIQERKRTSVTGTVQYRATDDLTLTLDGIYNKFTVKSNTSQVGHYFSPGSISNVKLDANNTVVGFDQLTDSHTDYVSRTFNRPTNLKALGFNAAWNPTDLIDVKFDSSWSKAENNNGGNEIFAVVGITNTAHFDNTGGGLPTLTTGTNYADPNAAGKAHFATRQGSNYGEEVFENRLDATFKTEYDHFTAVRLGGIFTDRTKTNQLVQSSSAIWCTYCGYSVSVPAGLLQTYAPSNFLDGEGGNFPRQWLSFDPEAYFKFLESQAAANAQDVAAGRTVGTSYAALQATNGFAATPQSSSYDVHEKVAGGYVQADFAGDIGGLPVSATVGARYVHTELTSRGQTQSLVDLTPITGDSTLYNATLTASAPVSKSASYDDFLPSLNVKIDLNDDMVARFAASKTVTRPNLTDLAPQLTFTSTRPGNLAASGGNPELKPYKSTNFDVSYEWYYQKSGFFTVGAFYKQLDNFIVVTSAPEVFTIANSANLAAFTGGKATFNVSRPRNIGSANVYGLEVGFQHTFDYLPAPLDGLGVTLNATFVKSSANDSGFALEGLGDSQNAVLFYAKGPFEVRVAYNRRDGFMSTQSNSTGGMPIYTKTAGQFDAQATYEINDNFSVFVEGTNLNDAKTQTHGVYQNQFLSLVETGPRYAVGARAKF
ncbi:TonB-dependent receptor [Caulobacter hibisci]|uniref:TonB-dependent receptor n=1 Tax=Caulobacter hibisci TaxID=2035993 RepID=A0ABS0SRG8_9CAUL|nr:TonB-dependent receptor [Caulobacter hibisci]MBI1682195.1 TonB-dependent receptor [Caulobacter hibisci]